MADPSLSRLFQRYAEDGDLHALGEVFDRTAPELHRVARHLAGHEAAAEDLVQATFLAAIEHHDQFDASRELVPWLLGILTNKARTMRTVEGRTPDLDRMSAPRSTDPREDAQFREFVATLDRALEKLPDAYRQVLRIHLAEGKGAEEIARELERSSDTVRVQLHRGLRHLRRRLPAGFALGGLVLVSAPRGMQVVRALVLERAAALAPAAAVGGTVAGVAGGVFVGKKILVAAIVIALASGSWWFLRQRARPTIDRSPNESPVAELEAPAERVPASPPVLGASESSSTSKSRESLVDSTDPYGSIDLEWTWSDGSPAAGIGIGAIADGEEFPNDHTFYATTDEAGHVAFDHIHVGPIGLQTDRGCSSELFQSSIESGRRTHARFAVRPGVEVRGQVFDPEGRPVVSARVWLTAYEDDGGVMMAKSGIDGSFSIRDVDPSCLLFATAPGFGGSAVETLRKPQPDAGGGLSVDLKLRGGGGSVEGVVRDPEDRTIAGAWVKLRCASAVQVDRQMSWPCLWMATESDGSYRFEGVHAGAVDVFVDVDGFAAWTGTTQVEAGRSARVDARMESGFVVQGTVRTPDGAPAEGAKITHGPTEVSPRYVWRRNLTAKTDAKGNCRLAGIPSGPTELRIVLEGAERTSRASTHLVGRSGDVLTWDAILLDTPRIVGHVVDDAGRPLVGWRVEVGTPEQLDFYPGSARSDAEGRFVLRDCADVLFTVAAYSPTDDGHDSRQAGARLDEVRPGGGEILLAVSKASRPGAFLIGRFVDEHGSPVGGTRILARSSKNPMNNSAEASPETGSFRLGPLVAGDYDLQVVRDGLPYRDLPKVDLRPDEERDLGTIAMKSSGRLELVLLREDDALVDKYSMRLYSGGYGHLLETDDGSTFRSKDLYEGNYTLFPVGRNVATVERKIEIRAGETTRLEVRLPAGLLQYVFFRVPEGEKNPERLHVTVRPTGGSPLFERELMFAQEKDGRSFASLVAGYAPGRYEIEATSADGWEARTSFEISPTATKTENLETPLTRKP